MTDNGTILNSDQTLSSQALGMLRDVVSNNSFEMWIAAAVVTAVVLVVLLGLKHAFRRRFLSKAEDEGEHSFLADFFLGLMLRVKGFMLVTAAVFFGSRLLVLSAPVSVIVEKAFIFAILLQTAIWCSFLVGHFLERYRTQKVGDDNASARASITAIRFLGRMIVWIVFLILILDNLGFNITALVAGLGVGGIAIALAAQNVLGDLFASFLIMLDKPFAVGDFIIVDAFLGTVEHVGLKTTRLRSLGGEQIVFSNADLLGSRVRNFKRMQERRIVFSIGVEYGTPHKLIEEIPQFIQRIIVAEKNARFDRAHFKEFGPSSLMFEVVYYTLNPDYTHYMDVQERINLAVYKKFEEKKIAFAFPTQTIHVQSRRKQPAKPRAKAVVRPRANKKKT